MIKSITVVKKLKSEVSRMIGEATMDNMIQDYKSEHELKLKALVISKRVSSYEVLVSKLSLNEKINVRPLTYFERCRNNYNLSI